MKNYAKYYFAETHGLFNAKDWHATKAETLAGAKRAARNKQRYLGTILLIATPKIDGTPRIVSFLDVDALDMSDKGRWIDRD
jgi:hypothetical protein